MRALVLDTGALSLHFRDDPRLRDYLSKIDGGDAAGYVSNVTLAEFYYKTCQKLGRQTADTWINLLEGSPITCICDAELDRSAGYEKCRRHRDLSLADCYALALAKRTGGLLLTTDSGLADIKEVEVRHFAL